MNAERIVSHREAVLEMLHPHNDFVTFHHGEQFKQVAAMRPAEFGSMLPALAEQLARDSFYSINAFKSKWRKAVLVSTLTSCFVDIYVCHNAPDPEQIELAVGVALAAAAAGRIPAPSFVVRSGRGCWLFWLLKSCDSDETSLRYDYSLRADWLRTQRGLAERLRESGVPVDGAAQDLARLTRLPESINSKSGTAVKYTVNYADDGQPLRYTLLGLIMALGLPEVHPTIPAAATLPTPTPATITRLTDGAQSGKSINARGGWQALRRRRRGDFLALVEMRGGHLRQGCRDHGVLIFVLLFSPDQRELTHFAQEQCYPALTPAEIRGVTKSAAQLRRLSDRTIGDWLRITVAENDNLAGDYLRGPLPASTKRRDTTTRRRELVSEICASTVPALRKIAGRLEAAGIHASAQTILNDLEALNVENPRTRNRVDADKQSLFALVGGP